MIAQAAPLEDCAGCDQGKAQERIQNSVPTLLLAVACGVVAANIYYLQPLAALVAGSIGLSKGAAGLVATMTQIGYGIGLVLVLPLADLVENRRLVATVLSLSVVALLVTASATKVAVLLPAAFLVGLGAVAVQLVVVYAAHLTREDQQGRVIGAVTSGLMLGIMLSRPAAGAIAQISSWRVVMLVAATLTAGIAVWLQVTLPKRHLPSSKTYRDMLASLPGLFIGNPVVRWRTVIHVNLFFGFGAFWTVVPLVLRDRFHLSEGGIALYALTGIASVLAAPIAGWMADRNHGAAGSACSILCVGAGFVAAFLGMPDKGGLLLLCLAALLIGAGVTAHAVLGQRDVFGLPPAIRARLNGLFMAAYFTAGAFGSAVAGLAYISWGWGATCALGLGAALIATVRFFLPGPHSHPAGDMS